MSTTDAIESVTPVYAMSRGEGAAARHRAAQPSDEWVRSLDVDAQVWPISQARETSHANTHRGETRSGQRRSVRSVAGSEVVGHSEDVGKRTVTLRRELKSRGIKNLRMLAEIAGYSTGYLALQRLHRVFTDGLLKAVAGVLRCDLATARVLMLMPWNSPGTARPRDLRRRASRT